ncbi:sensor histidine kinase [Pseudobacteroides cellulosolvens]|uniref:histidine kinase n=1 Tax=Pseudobacteroides cellulosolvens ATCC 35603 = DSM 2933 TaxID=398512 RepID=A0A0L6JVW8_9FIRM|nr:HAMP domain-containing sensor histidine kinase [Pseudobacteroides cellulosolvens]KNY29582.1 integral membrane sensor signal transduction histidine kinase [Pseudobacteroides cellulosolvens ATCC 35603 = DSM 2933]
MSIKIKLLLSNILMIMIPLISSLILAVILIGVNFDKTGFEHHKTGDQFDKVAQEIFKEFITISNDTLNNPDKLKDLAYLKSVDDKLKSLNSGIGFVVNNNIYYLSEKIDRLKFQNKISTESRSEDKSYKEKHAKDHDNIQYFNHDFKLSTGEQCTLYIFFDISPIRKFVSSFMSDFMKYFLLIVLFTNGVLTFIVSQSIVKPLRKLKYGVEQIKDGNLSFEISEKSKDEVGAVCRAFEEMRQRLKDALEQQLRYDEERNEFIASITHDLKTPITSIKGHVEGLRDGIADTPEKNDKYLDIVYKKAVDMDRLINDLTFYSNQALKKIPFNFSKANLKIFIEDMMDEYQIELEKLGISIASSYDLDDNTMVKADVEKLKRVIANIFENSIKYMDKEEGHINIDVQDKGNKVLIGIQDNGEGIKEEYLPNIFNRFYRADPSRNTSKGGSGLGLAIASQIIEEHGGKIWAESEFGKGTGIYFELEKIGEGNEKKDSDN